MTSSRSHYRYKLPRRGALTIEALVGLVLITLALGLAAQVSVVFKRQQQVLSMRQSLLQAKSHVATYAMALGYDDVSRETLERYTQEIGDVGRKMSWTIEVQETSAKLPFGETFAKRVSVNALPATSQKIASTKPLVMWRYPTTAQPAVRAKP